MVKYAIYLQFLRKNENFSKLISDEKQEKLLILFNINVIFLQ